MRKEELAAGFLCLMHRSDVDAVGVKLFELYGVDAAVLTPEGGGLHLDIIERFLCATLTFTDALVPVSGRKSDAAIEARAKQEAHDVLSALGKDPLQSSGAGGEGASLKEICAWLTVRQEVDDAAADTDFETCTGPPSPLEPPVPASPPTPELPSRDDADAQTADRLTKRLAAARAQRDAVAAAADVEEFTGERRIALLSKVSFLYFTVTFDANLAHY